MLVNLFLFVMNPDVNSCVGKLQAGFVMLFLGLVYCLPAETFSPRGHVDKTAPLPVRKLRSEAH